MSVVHERQVLHLGVLDFPISWARWLALVEQEFALKIHRTVWNAPPESLETFRQFDFVRVNRIWAQKIYSVFKASSPMIHQIGYVDFITQKNKALWPSLLHKETIHSVILEQQPFLNAKGAGLIIGIGAEAMISAFVLAELGLKQITFVAENEESSQKILQVLHQSLFEIHFDVISKDKVILLPGIYSVVICYEDLREQSDLLTALLYFNYLVRGGLVINAGVPLEKIPLVEEAHAIGAKVVDLPEFQIREELVALSKQVIIKEEQQKKIVTKVLQESLL